MKALFQATIIAAVLIAGTLAWIDKSVHAEVFGDTLDKIDSNAWTVRVLGTGPSVTTTTNGQVQWSIPVSSSDDPVFGGFEGALESRCAFTGDVDVQVDYATVSWPIANGVRAGLLLMDGNPYDPGTRRADAVDRISFGSPNDFPGWPRECMGPMLVPGKL